MCSIIRFLLLLGCSVLLSLCKYMYVQYVNVNVQVQVHVHTCTYMYNVLVHVYIYTCTRIGAYTGFESHPHFSYEK